MTDGVASIDDLDVLRHRAMPALLADPRAGSDTANEPGALLGKSDTAAMATEAAIKS